MLIFFFFNDTATTEIYTLSLHDALPIYPHRDGAPAVRGWDDAGGGAQPRGAGGDPVEDPARRADRGGAEQRHRGAVGDRKSTRLNSSHANISYAVFCLKKKKLCLTTAHT